MNQLAAIPKHLLHDSIPTITQGKNKLGKDDFMNLLLTQLRNQDPLKPMEHKEFASQLAQFGTLEKLTAIEEGIVALQAGVGQGERAQAFAMLGKSVKATGNSLLLTEGKPVSITHKLSEKAKPVQLTIFNESGKMVRDIPLNNKSGRNIEWDGRDAEGKELPSGKYSFRVLGLGENGQMEESGSALEGRVVGVDVSSGQPRLIIKTSSGKIDVAIDQVQSILSVETPVKESTPQSKADAKTAVNSAEGLQSQSTLSKDGTGGADWEPFDRSWRRISTSNPFNRGTR